MRSDPIESRPGAAGATDATGATGVTDAAGVAGAAGADGVAADRVLLTGWGRTAATAAQVVRPRSVEAIRQVLAEPPPRGLVARGLGRSYGDAAQAAGGLVVDCTGLAPALTIDAERGIVTAGAGLSFDRLLRDLLPLGWFVPVTPGTRHITVGGAVAADVHGKNHHVDGSFGAAVLGLTLVLPGGEVVRTGPGADEDPDLFWATVGGMGLTGVIVEATFRCLPVETSRMVVDTERTADLDDALARMAATDHDYHYSVAWIDLLARGRSTGRSVLTRARHARAEDLQGRKGLLADAPLAARDPLAFDPKQWLAAPPWVPTGLLRSETVRAFNAMWYAKAALAPTRRLQSLASYFHPLDGVAGWNRLYGRYGFVQYQFVVPFDGVDTLRSVVADLSAAGVASFLAVLKRFGPAGSGHLSFPMEGWTLALDVPVGATRLPEMLADFDTRVAAAGGRVYLAKDSTLHPDLVSSMYPRLEAWRQVRARVDPAGTLRSDLARRLGL
jgi:decaprenylphospho-beta-D-ribofuranose 2-oxidase